MQTAGIACGSGTTTIAREAVFEQQQINSFAF